MNRNGHIAGAIAELLAEREHLAARLAKVDAAIAAVREAFQLPSQPSAADRIQQPRERVKSTSNGNGHRAELTDGAIVEALKAGPIKPGELGAALGVERARLRARLAQLEARGVVVSTGVTASRRVALAGSRPKEAP